MVGNTPDGMEVSRKVDWANFDAMPPLLRRAISEAWYEYSAAEILAWLTDKFGMEIYNEKKFPLHTWRKFVAALDEQVAADRQDHRETA